MGLERGDAAGANRVSLSEHDKSANKPIAMMWTLDHPGPYRVAPPGSDNPNDVRTNWEFMYLKNKKEGEEKLKKEKQLEEEKKLELVLKKLS